MNQPNQPGAGTQTQMTDDKVAFMASGPAVVLADFARDLERSLTAAQQENERLREALADLLACIDETRGKIAYEAVRCARDLLTPPANPNKGGRPTIVSSFGQTPFNGEGP